MKTAVLLITVIFACAWSMGSGWPTFSKLKSFYPRYSSISFDGLVDQEGLDSWLKGLSNKNSCAMRVSRALTHAKQRINPSHCNWAGVKDREGRPYIIRVATMRCYLDRNHGAADVTGSSQSRFRGHKGIIVFQSCGFATASGHVDLWDGYSCVGNCPYFDNCSNIRLYKF